MTSTKKKLTLYEITQMFGETIKEQYFNQSTEERSFFMLVMDKSAPGCAAFGKQDDFIDMFVYLFRNEKSFAHMISTALAKVLLNAV